MKTLLAFILMVLSRPVCGAYDPVDYRCGKCDHCKSTKDG
jgi:hypothetical protein